jgi:hypothetical protein
MGIMEMAALAEALPCKQATALAVPRTQRVGAVTKPYCPVGEQYQSVYQ